MSEETDGIKVEVVAPLDTKPWLESVLREEIALAEAQSQRRREKQAEVWIVQRINELSPSMPKKEAVRQANYEWDQLEAAKAKS